MDSLQIAFWQEIWTSVSLRFLFFWKNLKLLLNIWFVLSDAWFYLYTCWSSYKQVSSIFRLSCTVAQATNLDCSLPCQRSPGLYTSCFTKLMAHPDKRLPGVYNLVSWDAIQHFDINAINTFWSVLHDSPFWCNSLLVIVSPGSTKFWIAQLVSALWCCTSLHNFVAHLTGLRTTKVVALSSPKRGSMELIYSVLIWQGELHCNLCKKQK